MDGASFALVTLTEMFCVTRLLGDLERRAELVKSGVMSSVEDAIADHQAVPLADHIAVFAESMKAKGCTADHRAKTERYLKRLGNECEFRRLGDLKKVTFESWIVKRLKDRWSARNRNAYQWSCGGISECSSTL